MSRGAYYRCFIEYMNQDGVTATVEWNETGRERAMLSVARQVGYYQCLGRIILTATIHRGILDQTGPTIDVKEVLYGEV